MSKAQYINICFSDRDKELIAWANMIREDGQSVNSWVQAILLAEAVGADIDAGAVYVPKNRVKPAPRGSVMFGDDRKPAKPKNKTASGWQVRGDNGEIVAGSIISIRVTRPVILGLLDNLRQSRSRIGPYAKAILRKRVRKLDAGPNIIPDDTQVQDMFALYEDRYTSLQAEPARTDSMNRTAQRREEPRQQREAPPPGDPMQAEKDYDRPRRDRNRSRNRNNRGYQQQNPGQPPQGQQGQSPQGQTSQTPPQNQYSQHQPQTQPSGPQKPQFPQTTPPQQGDRPPRNKNPLLGYIN